MPKEECCVKECESKERLIGFEEKETEPKWDSFCGLNGTKTSIIEGKICREHLIEKVLPAPSHPAYGHYHNNFIVHHFLKSERDNYKYSNEEINEALMPIALSQTPKEALENIIRIAEKYSKKEQFEQQSPGTSFRIGPCGKENSVIGCVEMIRKTSLGAELYIFFKDEKMAYNINNTLEFNKANLLEFDGKKFSIIKKADKGILSIPQRPVIECTYHPGVRI